MPVKQKEAVKAPARDFFERYLEVEQLLGLDVGFENPLAGMIIRAPADVEAAAEKLRQKWGLGVSALPNVLELLAAHQVKVYDLAAPDKFAGLSGWAGKIPVVVVNRRFPADRKRLTALHGLAHLILEFAKDRLPPNNRFDQLLYRAASSELVSLSKAASLAGKPLAAFRESLQLVP